MSVPARSETPAAAAAQNDGDGEERDFMALANDLENLEAIVAQWDEGQAGTARAIKQTVEEIMVGAMKRLIRHVKEAPGGLEALKGSLEDDWVRTVLQVHGILRAPGAAAAPVTLDDKVRAALKSVRPMLESHGGDVELVDASDEEVTIRLLGSCVGCSQSSVTVKLGIETAIREALPQLKRVVVKEGPAARPIAPGDELVSIGGNKALASPFSGRWEDAGPAEGVRLGVLTAVELEDVSVLLTRLADGELRAYPNACTHLGMPLDTGTVTMGPQGPEVECRYHGFRYRLDTGECQTAPEVQLPPYDVRVQGGRVLVRASSGGAA